MLCTTASGDIVDVKDTTPPDTPKRRYLIPATTPLPPLPPDTVTDRDENPNIVPSNN